MEKQSFLNRHKGTIISIFVHVIFLLLLLKSFKNEIFINPNLFRPTSTIGYQVELMHTYTNIEQISREQIKNSSALNDSVNQRQGEIKLKSNLVKSKSKPDLKKSVKFAKAQIVETKQVKKLRELQSSKINNADRNQDGVTMTNKNQVNIVASAPGLHTPYNQVGDGGEINSSTNGTGTQAARFDFRVIQYGRDAADAIRQNIVVPPNLANQYFTYRAYIKLNANMEYESMVLVKSTGNSDMDKIIARALKQTVYPPLPSGANFEQYRNIDFTIK